MENVSNSCELILRLQYVSILCKTRKILAQTLSTDAFPRTLCSLIMGHSAGPNILVSLCMGFDAALKETRFLLTPQYIDGLLCPWKDTSLSK
jgi:hypothetical protein